jgi:hypothetical protein
LSEKRFSFLRRTFPVAFLLKIDLIVTGLQFPFDTERNLAVAGKLDKQKYEHVYGEKPCSGKNRRFPNL